jgi:hypothetical protein
MMAIEELRNKHAQSKLRGKPQKEEKGIHLEGVCEREREQLRMRKFERGHKYFHIYFSKPSY